MNVVAVENTIPSKLHDVKNQAPKLALFERGKDICLALVMYDVQTVKLQLQLQVGEC